MEFGSINNGNRINSYPKKVESASKSDVMNYDVLKEEEKEKRKKQTTDRKDEKEVNETDDDTGTLINVKW